MLSHGKVLPFYHIFKKSMTPHPKFLRSCFTSSILDGKKYLKWQSSDKPNRQLPSLHGLSQHCVPGSGSKWQLPWVETGYQGYPTRAGVCRVPRFHVKSQSCVNTTFAGHPLPDTCPLMLQGFKCSLQGAAEIEAARRNKPSNIRNKEGPTGWDRAE